MFTIQQRFHHRGGVLTVAVPAFLKRAARQVLRSAVRATACRVHVTVALYPDPVVTRINWRVEHRGKAQGGSRYVILRSNDFAVYNERDRSIRSAVAPIVLGSDRWLTAVQYSVGDILQAANNWAHAPKAQRTPIRLADMEGIDYGLV